MQISRKVNYGSSTPRYRCQFYYRVHQMYGTGEEEYDDLSECMVTLLQVQADYAASQDADTRIS